RAGRGAGGRAAATATRERVARVVLVGPDRGPDLVAPLYRPLYRGLSGDGSRRRYGGRDDLRADADDDERGERHRHGSDAVHASEGSVRPDADTTSSVLRQLVERQAREIAGLLGQA